MAHRIQRAVLVIAILSVGVFGLGFEPVNAQEDELGGQGSGYSEAIEEEAAGNAAASEIEGCNSLWPPSWVGSCLTSGIINISSWLLIGAGAVLDVFINFTLNPDFYGVSGGGSGAEQSAGNGMYIFETWQTMRDLANMAFILGIIVVSLLMITGMSSQQSGVDWQKTLTRLIIIALLLNFSFFFSRLIIDAGNIMGNFFYTQIAESTNQTNNVGESFTGGTMRIAGFDANVSNLPSVSAPIVHSLFLVSDSQSSRPAILSINTVNDIAEKGQAYVMALNILILVVSIAAAWSLFKTGFVFITRTLYLIILTIVSPLAFVSYFIPKLNGFQSWMKHMLNKSFCVCVYLFLIYLLLIILGNISEQQNNFGSGAEIELESLVIFIVINLGFIFGILGIANSRAKEMCEGPGGGIGSKIQGVVTGAAGMAAGGALGAGAMMTRKGGGGLARATIGNWGRQLSRSDYVSEKIMSEDRGTRALGNILYSAGNAAANKKWGTQRSAIDQRSKKGQERRNIIDFAAKNMAKKYESEERENMINTGLEQAMRGATGQQEIENERARLLQKRSQTKREQEKMMEMGLSPNDAKKRVDEEILTEAEKKAAEKLRPQVEQQLSAKEIKDRATRRQRERGQQIFDANKLEGNKTSLGSWLNWAMDGGVDGYGEASENFEVVQGGEKNAERTKRQNINERSRLAVEAKNKTNKMDAISEKLLRNLTDEDMGMVINKNSIDKLKNTNMFKQLDTMLQEAFSYQAEDVDGNVQTRLDTENYQATLGNFTDKIRDIEDQFSSIAQEAVTDKQQAQKDLQELRNRDDATPQEITNAEKQLKDAVNQVRNVQGAINKEKKVAKDQLVDVARAKFQAQGDATTSMGQAGLSNVIQRGHQAEQAASEGEAKAVNVEDTRPK